MPRTLKKPCCVTSMTRALPFCASAALMASSPPASDQSLSRLTTGQWMGFFFRWKW